MTIAILSETKNLLLVSQGTTCRRFAMLLTFLFSLLLYGSAYGQQNDFVQQIILQVRHDSLVRTVRELSGEDEIQLNGTTSRICTRVSRSAGNELATEYLAERLRSYGLSVELHSFDTSHPGLVNVVAVQPGTTSPARAVIICAHFDNFGVSDTIPGADDNASGSAAVLEAARILSAYKTDATVVYALWNDEEAGMRGSYEYAKRSSERGDSILGVINVDMIGWDSDSNWKCDIHARNVMNSQSLADSLEFVNETYTLGLAPVTYNPGTANSDQASFWKFGYGAVLFIEAYWGGDFNQNYHTINDKIGRFNIEFFHRCAKLAIGTIATLAGIVNPTEVNVAGYTPRQARLFQNYPNPFNPITTIRFEVPDLGFVTLKVYDVLGREIVTLVDKEQTAGDKSVTWDATGIPSGVYFYEIKAGSYVETRKLLLLK